MGSSYSCKINEEYLGSFNLDKLYRHSRFDEITYLSSDDCRQIRFPKSLKIYHISSNLHSIELPELPDTLTELSFSLVINSPCRPIKINKLPHALEKLYCYRCYLEHLDLEQVPNLKVLSCPRNLLEKIDNIKNLEKLNCCSNKLFELELPPKLTELYCSRNYIRKLDLPKL